MAAPPSVAKSPDFGAHVADFGGQGGGAQVITHYETSLFLMFVCPQQPSKTVLVGNYPLKTMLPTECTGFMRGLQIPSKQKHRDQREARQRITKAWGLTSQSEVCSDSMKLGWTKKTRFVRSKSRIPLPASNQTNSLHCLPPTPLLTPSCLSALRLSPRLLPSPLSAQPARSRLQGSCPTQLSTTSSTETTRLRTQSPLSLLPSPTCGPSLLPTQAGS